MRPHPSGPAFRSMGDKRRTFSEAEGENTRLQGKNRNSISMHVKHKTNVSEMFPHILIAFKSSFPRSRGAMFFFFPQYGTFQHDYTTR